MEKKFYLIELPYPVNGLEPYIDAETIQVHHFVLQKRYVDKLNAILEGYPEYSDWSLVELIEEVDTLPAEIQTGVFRNAGGVLNHNYYFDMMHSITGNDNSTAKPWSGNPPPTGGLKAAIDRKYGTFEMFQKQFKAMAMDVFGSGYTWLVADAAGNLNIINIANQITPYTYDAIPIIPIDIWEHAYFLQYQAERVDYIDAWFQVADWAKAGIIYDSIGI